MEFLVLKHNMGHYLWSCAGPKIMSQPLLKKYVDHYLWAGTRPAPAFGRLGRKVISVH